MKLDDSCLDDGQQARVKRAAMSALQAADAIGRYPTPIDDIIAASGLKLEAENVFDESFLADMRSSVTGALKGALGKVMGLAETKSGTVLVDHRLPPAQLPFLKLHELGHLVMPWQRSAYALIEDCEQALDPETADLFERQANVFASEVQFQGSRYTEEAAELPFGLRAPLDLARRYGSSVYASLRRYVSTHAEPCCLLVIDLPGDDELDRLPSMRRVINSEAFGPSAEQVRWEAELAASGSTLSSLIPSRNSRMRRPKPCGWMDVSGNRIIAIGEAFVRQQQAFLLIHRARVLGPCATGRRSGAHSKT